MKVHVSTAQPANTALPRPEHRRTRRRAGALSCLFAMAGVLVVALLFISSPDPARGDGLNFGCVDPTPSSSTTTAPPKTAGDQLSQALLFLTDISKWTSQYVALEFDGEALPGTGPVTKTVSLSPQWTQVVPWNVFTQTFSVSGLTGAPTNVPDVFVTLRLTAATDSSPMQDILKKSFGFGAFDLAGVTYNAVRLDVTVARNPLTPSQYRYNGLSGAVRMKVRTDVNDPYTVIEARLASEVGGHLSLTPDGEYPETATMGVGYRPGNFPSQGFLMAAGTTKYRTAVETRVEDRPSFTQEVRAFIDGVETSPLADVHLNWKHGPASLGVGTNVLCDPKNKATSRTQLSMQTKFDSVVSPPPANQLGISVRAGAGKGIDGRDEMNFTASASDVPTQLDVVFRPSSVIVSRAVSPNGVPVDLGFDMAMAGLDSTAAADAQEPLLASGTLLGLPERAFVQYEPDGSGIPRTLLEFCPATNPVPAETIVATGPCSGGSQPYATDATVHVQNYLPGTVNPKAGLPEFTPPSGGQANWSYVDFASVGAGMCQTPASLNDDACDRPKIDLLRLDVRLRGVRSGVLGVPSGTVIGDTAAQVRTDLTQAQSTVVGIHVDTRGDLDDAVYTGNLLDVTGAVDALPAQADVTFISGIGRPVRLDAMFSAAVGSLEAHASPRVPGFSSSSQNPSQVMCAVCVPPPALQVRLDGVLDDLPPDVHVHWSESHGPNLPTENTLRFETSPVAATDPAPDANVTLDISTPEERQSTGTRTAVKASLVLPRGEPGQWLGWIYQLPTVPFLEAGWTTGSDGGFQKLHFDSCDLVGLCDNKADAAVTVGYHDLDLTTLTPPSMPPTPALGNGGRHPAFRPPTSNEGVKIVSFGADPTVVALDARLANVHHVSFEDDGTSVQATLRTVPTGAPFEIRAFLEAGTGLGGAVGQPQSGRLPYDIFADGTLSRMPDQFGLRIWREPTLNTPLMTMSLESALNLTNPGSWSPGGGPAPGGPPQGAPVTLSGLVRIGDKTSLLTSKKWIRTHQPDPGWRGIDAQLWIPPDDGATPVTELAADAFLQEDLPTKLTIWAPTDLSCTSEVANFPNCAFPATLDFTAMPHWESNEKMHYQAAIDSTATDLGRVDVEAGFGKAVNGRYRGKAGTWPDTLVYASADKLPGSLQIDGNVTTNRRIPGARFKAELKANTPIDELRAEVWKPADPAKYRVLADPNANGATVDTSTYGFVLRNVPTHFTLSGALWLPEAVNYKSSSLQCNASEPTSLAYVHGDVDLKGKASALRFDAKETPDGEHAAELHTFGDPVDARLALKIDHVQAQPVDAPAAGWVLCMDTDVPVDLDIHNASWLRLGNRAMGLTVDFPRPVPATTVTLNTAQRGMAPYRPGGPYAGPGESALATDGMYVWQATKNLGFGLIGLPFYTGGGTVNNVFRTPVFYNWKRCSNTFSMCWEQNQAAPITFGATWEDSNRATSTWAAHSVIVDPLLDAGDRTYLSTIAWFGFPLNWLQPTAWAANQLFTDGLAPPSRPVENWQFPDPSGFGVPFPFVGFVSTLGCGKPFTIAWAQDMTKYEYTPKCDLLRISGEVHATWNSGADRWTVPLGSIPAEKKCFNLGGDCDVKVEGTPLNDGSLSIHITTFNKKTKKVLGTQTQIVDASGHPARTKTPPDPNTPIEVVVHTGRTVTLDPCALPSSPWACNGNIYWQLGDGTSTFTAGFGSKVTHDYPEAGGKTYLAVLCKQGPDDTVAERVYVRVTVM